MKEIRIWTDGSATIHGKKMGGSGAFIKYPDREEGLSQGWINTKTGRAEIHALILALQELRNEPSRVTFYMDSEYVQKSMTEYLRKWIASNWMGMNGPVKNKDLWLKVISHLKRLNRVKFDYFHVKGHQDNLENEVIEGNMIADYLANYKTQRTYLIDLK